MLTEAPRGDDNIGVDCPIMNDLNECSDFFFYAMNHTLMYDSYFVNYYHLPVRLPLYYNSNLMRSR
jgi:hypothetical protein